MITKELMKVFGPNKSRRSGTSDFNFKEHCLFCGEKCAPLGSSSRHPYRLRNVIQCQIADNFKQNILLACDVCNEIVADEADNFKKNILLTCDVRNEIVADEVRVSGAVSDLHAADGQYPDDFFNQFMNSKNVQAAAKSATHCPQSDAALDSLIEEVSGNKSHVWNSLEIHGTYTEHGCTILSRSKLIKRLLDHFGDDLLVLSGYGVASILIFRSKAPRLLKLVDEDDEINVTFIVKTIKNEFSERSADRETYKTRPFLEDATDAYR